MMAMSRRASCWEETDMARPLAAGRTGHGGYRGLPPQQRVAPTGAALPDLRGRLARHRMLLEKTCERAGAWILEHADERPLAAERRLELGMHLRHQERMAAGIE